MNSNIYANTASVGKHLFQTVALRDMCQHQLMDFQGEVCGREFPFQSELATHQTIHSEEKKFTCQYPRCNGKYKTKAEYRRHYKTHRPMSKEHKCPVCNKVFTKAKYLKRAQASSHR